jgi:microcystin-dependent protein
MWGGNPTGTILSFFGETAPEGYLICDGEIYDKETYPELAEHLLSLTDNTAYIVSEDETKFKVPDLRGEFLRGTGTNSHENQGSGGVVGEHQDGTEFPHLVTDAGSGTAFVYKTNSYEGDTNIDSEPKTSIGRRNLAGSHEGFTDRSGTITSRPTNTSVLYCIKF